MVIKGIYKNITESLKLVCFFYGVLAFLFLFTFLFDYDANLKWAIGIILCSNFLIALFTQISPFILFTLFEKGNNPEKHSEDHLYKYFRVCSIRCIAGLLEMVFYTISFAINSVILIVGYLVLKTLSYWAPEKLKHENKNHKDLSYSNNVKEGLSTANLRIAVVLSLIASLIASYFLFQFLQSSTIFNLSNHFLFGVGQ